MMAGPHCVPNSAFAANRQNSFKQMTPNLAALTSPRGQLSCCDFAESQGTLFDRHQ